MTNVAQLPGDARRPFVLVIDDEWRLASNIVRYLQRLGLAAEGAPSVAAANRIIAMRKPDLAIVDLKLPDAGGVDFCRMLRRCSPAMPLIAISASIDTEAREALATLGVRAMLTKPFALECLRAELAGLLPLPPGDAAADAAGPKADVVPLQRPQLAAADATPAQRHRGGPRIALYSHDTMGLGHMRRNLLLARTLAESRLGASVLLVSGAREVGRFELPAGIDCVVLPSYRKSADGEYRPRHLDLETRELASLRAQAINASVSAFRPDLLIVDNVPRGALNELDPVLSMLSARGGTRCVLGLRDVLDAPEPTRREWAERRNLAAVDWHYDQVWVYGDPAVYDLRAAYGFGDAFAAKTLFTGYLDASMRAPARDRGPDGSPRETADMPAGPFDLCLVGGGQDGFALALAFAQSNRPEGVRGLLITGPFMAPEQVQTLERIAARRHGLTVLGFVPEPVRLLPRARRVVAMGGYNSVNELLACGRPALIVPRVRPRLEQLVRARRLAELGHVDLLHPDALSAQALERWLADTAVESRRPARPLDLRGLGRVVDFAEALLRPAEVRHATA